VLRPAVSHLGVKNTPVSGQNPTVETVSQMDGNTGSFQAKFNSNSGFAMNVRTITEFIDGLS